VKIEKATGILVALVALSIAISIGALFVATVAFSTSQQALYKTPKVLPRTALIVGYVFRDTNWNSALDEGDFVGQECFVMLNHYQLDKDLGYYRLVNFTIAKVDSNGQYCFQVPTPLNGTDEYGFRIFLPEWYLGEYQGIKVIGTSWITVTNQTSIIQGPIFLVILRPLEEARG